MFSSFFCFFISLYESLVGPLGISKPSLFCLQSVCFHTDQRGTGVRRQLSTFSNLPDRIVKDKVSQIEDSGRVRRERGGRQLMMFLLDRHSLVQILSCRMYFGIRSDSDQSIVSLVPFIPHRNNQTMDNIDSGNKVVVSLWQA